MDRARAEDSARFDALARETREAVEAVPAPVERGARRAGARYRRHRAARSARRSHGRGGAEAPRAGGAGRPAQGRRLRARAGAGRRRQGRRATPPRRDRRRRGARRGRRARGRGGARRPLGGAPHVARAAARRRWRPRSRGSRLPTGSRRCGARLIEVKRLVESKLEEAGGQSRRLSGFLRRALEELEPPGKALTPAELQPFSFAWICPAAGPRRPSHAASRSSSPALSQRNSAPAW